MNREKGPTPLINYVSNDPIQSEKIKLYFNRNRRLIIKITSEPLEDYEAVCAYVVPIEQLDQLQQLVPSPFIKSFLPIIGYGPATRLRYAFLNGCTDYLKEPWYSDEMETRIVNALKANQIELHWGSINISPSFLESELGSVPISYQEYIICKLLIANYNKIVPREAFYYALWGRQGTNSRVVDMHISHLRKKIQTIIPKSSEIVIHSARRYGYYIQSKTDV